MVKPDLTLSEYRQFHRPRLPLAAVQPSISWRFQTRVVSAAPGTKRRPGHPGPSAPGPGGVGGDGSTVVGSYHAMISAGSKAQARIRNEADLSPNSGDIVVLEYSEERPPLVMSKGMTARIVNYYRGDRARCPISAGGGDRPMRKRHGDRAASSLGGAAGQGGASGPSNRAERPPRLLGPGRCAPKSPADLIGIDLAGRSKSGPAGGGADGAEPAKKKAKEKVIDVLPEGVTEILHNKVHGPFIGDVEDGQTQTGLVSNLFAAPMYRHESDPTDFLMVMGQLRETKTTGPLTADAMAGLGVALRPLPRSVYCVGQTQPRVKVFQPNSNDEKKVRLMVFLPFVG